MKRVLKEKLSVYSTMIKSVSYAPMQKTLIVKYNSGDAYKYDGIKATVFEELREAPSKGKFLHAYVIGTYKFKKLK